MPSLLTDCSRYIANLGADNIYTDVVLASERFNIKSDVIIQLNKIKFNCNENKCGAFINFTKMLLKHGKLHYMTFMLKHKCMLIQEMLQSFSNACITSILLDTLKDGLSHHNIHPRQLWSLVVQLVEIDMYAYYQIFASFSNLKKRIVKIRNKTIHFNLLSLMMCGLLKNIYKYRISNYGKWPHPILPKQWTNLQQLWFNKKMSMCLYTSILVKTLIIPTNMDEMINIAGLEMTEKLQQFKYESEIYQLMALIAVKKPLYVKSPLELSKIALINLYKHIGNLIENDSSYFFAFSLYLQENKSYIHTVFESIYSINKLKLFFSLMLYKSMPYAVFNCMGKEENYMYNEFTIKFN